MSDRNRPKKASKPKAKRPRATTSLTLSAQQERFVLEYLGSFPRNATAAYERAGYRATGAAARSAAARLLKQPAVAHAIAQARNADAAAFQVDRERVLAEYAKIAFADPRKLFHDNGTLKHPVELDDATAASLVQFELEEEYEDLKPDEELEPQAHGGKLKRRAAVRVAVGRTAKVKWADKRAALDSIVRLMGWAKDNSTLGTPQNPVVMMLQDMQGRSSALTPVDNPDDDDD